MRSRPLPGRWLWPNGQSWSNGHWDRDDRALPPATSSSRTAEIATPTGPAWRYLRSASRAEARLLAPPLLAQEVGNALLTGVRRDRWDGLEADTMFGLMCQLPVTVLHDSAHVARAWELSRRYDEHPLYDMVYVALAERLGDTLVTADEVLLRRVGHLPYVAAP